MNKMKLAIIPALFLMINGAYASGTGNSCNNPGNGNPPHCNNTPPSNNNGNNVYNGGTGLGIGVGIGQGGNAISNNVNSNTNNLKNTNTNTNMLNNSNTNLNNNYQGQGQSQGQHQGIYDSGNSRSNSNSVSSSNQSQGQSINDSGNSYQSQGQSVDNSGNSNQAQSANNEGNSQNVNINNPRQYRITPSMANFVPIPTSPCMASIGGSGAVPGIGISIAGTYINENCEIQEAAKTMLMLGQPEAAIEIACSGKHAGKASICRHVVQNNKQHVINQDEVSNDFDKAESEVVRQGNKIYNVRTGDVYGYIRGSEFKVINTIPAEHVSVVSQLIAQ